MFMSQYSIIILFTLTTFRKSDNLDGIEVISAAVAEWLRA